MKPKNKLQRKIVALKVSNKNKATIEKWAMKECLPHVAILRKSGDITCLDCAYVWKTSFKESWKDILTNEKCPNCKTKIEVKLSRKSNFTENNCYSVIQTCEDYQLVRLYDVKAYYNLSSTRSVFIREVVRIYIDQEGHREVFACLQNGYSGTFGYDLDLRDKSTVDSYEFWPKQIYPKIEILDIFKKENFHELFNSKRASVCFSLLANPKYETLYKSDQKALTKYCETSEYSDKINRFWDSIKICFRNKYLIEDPGIWFDYLEFLRFFRKDLRNSKYVCPKNLRKEHNRYSEKKRNYMRKKQAELLKKERLVNAQKYIERNKKFFDLEFVDKNISVTVFKSIDEIEKEGRILKHCVYTSGYYTKENSLLLSIKFNGVPKETAEVYLDQMKLIQCRGYDNVSSRYHKRIVSLIQENLPVIQNIIRPKRRKSKAKQAA